MSEALQVETTLLRPLQKNIQMTVYILDVLNSEWRSRAFHIRIISCLLFEGLSSGGWQQLLGSDQLPCSQSQIWLGWCWMSDKHGQNKKFRTTGYHFLQHVIETPHSPNKVVHYFANSNLSLLRYFLGILIQHPTTLMIRDTKSTKSSIVNSHIPLMLSEPTPLQACSWKVILHWCSNQANITHSSISHALFIRVVGNWSTWGKPPQSEEKVKLHADSTRGQHWTCICGTVSSSSTSYAVD